MNRLLVRIQIYESMLRDSLWSPEREAERRRREAELRKLGKSFWARSGLSWAQ